jgi:hypothetical protein
MLVFQKSVHSETTQTVTIILNCLYLYYMFRPISGHHQIDLQSSKEASS